nr:hypothetical protein [Sulfitobacter aestuariivivens]
MKGVQRADHLLWWHGVGKGREPTKICKQYGDLAAPHAQGVVAAIPFYDQVGNLCRQKAAQTVGALDLVHLLGDLAFERRIPTLQLGLLGLDLFVKRTKLIAHGIDACRQITQLVTVRYGDLCIEFTKRDRL